MGAVSNILPYHSSHFTIARLKSTLCQGCSQHPFWLGGWTLIVGLQQDRLHPKGPDLHQLLQPSEKNNAEKTGRDHLQVEELQCGSFQTNLKSIALGNPGKCLCRQILLMETSTFPDRLHGGEEIRTFHVFAWLVSSECDRTEKRDSLEDSCSRQHSWSHCCLFCIFLCTPHVKQFGDARITTCWPKENSKFACKLCVGELYIAKVD